MTKLTINLPDDFAVVYGNFTLTAEDLANVDPKGQAYLLQYGFAQSLQDSIAGYAAKLAKETVSKEDATLRWNDEEIDRMVHDKQADRMAAIIRGDVGSGRVGPRATGIEAVMRDVAWEVIHAHAAKTKSKLPTVAADKNALIDQYLAKYAAKTRAEAQRRMDAVEEIDISLPAA